MLSDKYKVKAKSIESNDWVEGALLTDSLIVERVNHDGTIVVTDINPATICKATGLYDKYQIPIYENDIVEYFNCKSGKVCYKNSLLTIEGFSHASYYYRDRAFSEDRIFNTLIVLGNYYDKTTWEV